MQWRLFPHLTQASWAFKPYILIVVAIVCLFGFIAGFSINSFLRRLLLPMLIMFIMLPCLVLFNENSMLILLYDPLMAVINNLLWVIFSVALIEFYSGSFWFYGIAAATHLTNVFLFTGSIASRYLPSGTEYTILQIIIAAALLALLSFRLRFPKTQTRTDITEPLEESPVLPAVADIDGFFLKLGLSKRETEVANLLLEKGLGAKEIAEKLSISIYTAQDHVKNIYRKFGVSRRPEFMAKFVKKK